MRYKFTLDDGFEVTAEPLPDGDYRVVSVCTMGDAPARAEGTFTTKEWAALCFLIANNDDPFEGVVEPLYALVEPKIAGWGDARPIP